MIPHVQLLNYLAGAYHIQSKKKGRLQHVIPIVFYHGKRKYSKKKMLSYFSEAPSGTIKYLPLFEYFLIDMASYSDEKLWSLGNSFLSATMLTMKHYKDPVWLSIISNLFIILYFLHGTGTYIFDLQLIFTKC